MRVVFFVQGERVPAAKARGQEVAVRLQAAGVACEVRIPHPSVYGDTRLPRWLAWPRPLYSLAAVAVRAGQLGGLRPDDIVYFQRPMVELPTLFFERRVSRGRAAVFDFDDAIYLNRYGQRKFSRLVAEADHVVAGNAVLAEAAGAPHKTSIIPTVVDCQRLRPRAREPRRGREVVLGWTGLSVNYHHLLTVQPVLERVIQRTGCKLRLISNDPPPSELTRLGAEFRRWDPASEADDLAEIDIGLMPLPDSPYARGKCAYKLLQYMALGIPGVASPVGANSQVVADGISGCLPKDETAWERVLLALIAEPERRDAIGAAARQRVEAAYSYDAVLPLYTEILRRLTR